MNKNMKKIVLWTFAIMIVSFGISAGLFMQAGENILHITDSDKQKDIENNVDITKNIEIEKVENIDIDMISTNVKVISEDRKDIKIHFYGTTNEKVTPLNIEKKDNSIFVKEKKKNEMVINIGKGNGSDTNLDVYIPKDYSKNIDIEAVSGEIDFGKLQMEMVNISTVSGDIEGEEIDAKKGSFKTVSGDIEIEASKGNLYAKSVSGDMSTKVEDLKDDLAFKSTSGNIEIKFFKTIPFRLEASSTSGEINCEFPIKIEKNEGRNKLYGNVGKGEDIKNTIHIDTVSGDIDLGK
ncbi:MAG: DUF4097 domain-containing protein [Marinisporobacter sp.]|jgi:lia operon protein LiaG|nr:DUF4097 domain-containing protein [Marinisporobacter sp.]